MWHEIWVYLAERIVWHLGVKVCKTYFHALYFVIQNNCSLSGENMTSGYLITVAREIK
jgi:hypothetical protein